MSEFVNQLVVKFSITFYTLLALFKFWDTRTIYCVEINHKIITCSKFRISEISISYHFFSIFVLLSNKTSRTSYFMGTVVTHNNEYPLLIIPLL